MARCSGLSVDKGWLFGWERPGPARLCGLATSTLCSVGEEAAQARDADRRQNSEGSKSSKSDTTFQIIIKAYLSGKDKLA